MDNKEKAPVGATIGAWLRILLLPVALVSGLLAVAGFARHESSMDIVMGGLCAVIAVLSILGGIKGIAKLREAKAGWARYNLLKSVGPGEELSDVLDLYTVPEKDPELQQRLRDWKLRGGSVELKLRSNDGTGEVSFTYAGDYIGQPEETIRAWITENFDKIQSIQSAVVIGGGHTDAGQPRPFSLRVTLRLTEPAVHPVRAADPLPAVRYAFGFPGDRVCVLTKTGKIHTCPPSCGIGDAGLQRYLLDDLDEDKYSLCLKCYRDYF